MVFTVKSDGGTITTVGLEELEGEAGAHGAVVWQVQCLHEEGGIRGGPCHVVAVRG
jgi:hypothetical protein